MEIGCSPELESRLQRVAMAATDFLAPDCGEEARADVSVMG